MPLKVIVSGTAAAAVANNIGQLGSDKVASRKTSPSGVKMPRQSLQFALDGFRQPSIPLPWSIRYSLSKKNSTTRALLDLCSAAWVVLRLHRK